VLYSSGILDLVCVLELLEAGQEEEEEEETRSKRKYEQEKGEQGVVGGRKRRSFACFSQQAGGCFPCGKNSSGFMSDQDIQIPGAFDPFADANAEDSGAGSKDYVHVRVQQRNGRKSLTTVQGLKKEFNYNKILKDFKKVYHLLLCL
jgi:hypothetical protein